MKPGGPLRTASDHAMTMRCGTGSGVRVVGYPGYGGTGQWSISGSHRGTGPGAPLLLFTTVLPCFPCFPCF